MQKQPVHERSPSSKKWLLIGPASLLLLSLFIESDRRDVLGAANALAAVGWLVLVIAGFASHQRTEKLIRLAGIAMLLAAVGLFLLWLVGRT